MNKKISVPLSEKYMLTVAEAAQYYNMSEQLLRRIAKENLNKNFIFIKGSRVQFKRELFNKYLDNISTI